MIEGLTERTVHLCLDMQRLFSAEGPWPTPWMDRVLPLVAALADRFPERTIPPERPEQMPGMWQRYYRRWPQTLRGVLAPEMLELMPPLAKLSPPAATIDKTRYSAFEASALLDHLMARRADGLIITGSETDVCVLATVLAAVDIGYRVIVVEDAICSSSDEGHDALMKVYNGRYSEQIDVTDVETILKAWE
jgi:nicotinamidase-related amidase